MKDTIDTSPTNLYIMIDKIREILNSRYELTHEEIDLEDKLWHDRIVQCWSIDVESEPTESEAEAKRKQKEYQHQYYINHRKQSNKIVDMSERSVKNRATMTKFRNRLCLYENETVKYGTLMARMHNKWGYSWPDAKKICDEALIKD